MNQSGNNISSFSKYDYINIKKYDARFNDYIKPYLEIINDPFPKEYNEEKISDMLAIKIKANAKIRGALKVAAKRYPKQIENCMYFKLDINDSAGNKENAKRYKAHLKKMEEEQSKTMPKLGDISHFDDVLSMINKEKQEEYKKKSWNANIPKENFPDFNMNHFGGKDQNNSIPDILQSINSSGAAPAANSYSTHNEENESNFNILSNNSSEVDDVISELEKMNLNQSRNFGIQKNNGNNENRHNNDKNDQNSKVYTNNPNNFWKKFCSNTGNSKKIFSNDGDTSNFGITSGF